MTDRDIIKEARRLAATITRLSASQPHEFMNRATLGRARSEARILASRLEGEPRAARAVMVLRFLGERPGEPATRMH